MAKIAILNEGKHEPFEGEQYVVDLNRRFGGYESGDIICYVRPFFGVNLLLEIAIRKNGNIVFRKWDMCSDKGNNYLHTDALSEEDAKAANRPHDAIIPTQEQIDTVNGLWSGRIKFDGLEIPVGGTMQRICPIDKNREEQLVGHKIYLA